MDEKLLRKPSPEAKRLTPKTPQFITKERLKEVLPKGSRSNVTDELLTLIANMGEEVDLPQESLEEDLMSYAHLMGKSNGSPRFEDLINAVKFCNLKRNYDTVTAWSIVFPSRYKRLKEGKKQVSNHVAMYNKTKLVIAIDKEMLIPPSLQYAPYFHAAVKKQFDLMNGKAGATNADGEEMTVTPMVMHLAAKELALITKQPEEAKIDLKITQSDAMLQAQQDMNQQLQDIVANQAKMFQAGGDVGDVQRIHITHKEDDLEADILEDDEIQWYSKGLEE